MDIIPKKLENSDPLNNVFWLFFHFKAGKGYEWTEENLPIPTIIKHINRGVFIAWAIEGYFGTPKSKNFINDIIARILITFNEYEPERLSWKPTRFLNDKNAHILKKAYKLKEFSKKLKSKKKQRKYAPSRADSFEDFTFWAMKLYAEDEIRNYGFIVYESFENWALSQFLHKEKSTIRAKARSIWNYYNDRDFKLKEKEKKYENHKKYLEETMPSRQEHMVNLNKKREAESYKKIVNTITGLYADTYKKKNGKWNISKISRELKMHRDTIAKHLKAFEEKLKP